MTALPHEPKIVLINRFFFPDESATSQILTDVAAHLRGRGFRVVVVASRYCLDGGAKLARRETTQHDIEVRRLWGVASTGRSVPAKLLQFACFYPIALIELVRSLSRGDILVAKTDPPLISVIAWIAAKLRRAHLVNWMQDVYPEVAAELKTPMLSGKPGSWLRSLRNISLKSAAATVVIGEKMAERLSQEGVPHERLHVIPNWVDEEAVRPIATTTSVLRHAWGFERGDFVFGYSGNLGRAHEADTIVAAASLLSDRKDIKFLFVGGGSEYARLRSLAAERNLQSLVFRPHQRREDLHDSLGAADAHWLSLRPELEGLIVPSKLYGILAAGRPVVAVAMADGEVARVVREHQCGFVVEPGDATGLANCITKLADEADLVQSLGQRAREASERCFPKASALAQWEQLVSELQQGALRRDATEGYGLAFS